MGPRFDLLDEINIQADEVGLKVTPLKPELPPKDGERAWSIIDTNDNDRLLYNAYGLSHIQAFVRGYRLGKEAWNEDTTTTG